MKYCFDTYKKEHLRAAWLSGEHTEETIMEKYWDSYLEYCEAHKLEGEDRLYVVCMDSYWIRDAQMFDTSGIMDEDLDELDPSAEEHECRWHDIEPNPFIGLVRASSEEHACSIAGSQFRYDPRCLYAFLPTNSRT